jgi:hypothetical protein
MTYVGGSPSANSSDANVRRKECGVSPSGNGCRPLAARAAFARSTARVNMRMRTFRRPDRPSAARRKDAPVRTRFKPIAISGELATQDRQHVNDPHASVGLGLAHPDRAAVEVHVMPVERQHLSEAETGEGEGGDQRATQANGSAALLIEFPGAVQQRCDVLGAVEPGPGRRDGWEESLAPLGGVAGEQLVFNGVLQDGRQGREHFVDRCRAECALANLRETKSSTSETVISSRGIAAK